MLWNKSTCCKKIVIAEVTETLTAMTYIGCLTLAFYGPNAETIGNVKNGWFHFIAIEDFGYTIKFVALFFLVDLGSMVVNASLLWMFSRINLYQAFSALQNEFWLAFGNNLAIIYMSVKIAWV